MILGMTTFTFVHVVLSLIGILSGLVVVFGLLGGKRLDGWTALFLVTTGANERDRVSFSVSQVFAIAWDRHRIAGGAGDCHLCAVRPATRRGLAPWLRGQCRDCAVSECVRIDRAAFHEGAGAEGDGADGVRAALLGCAARMYGALRRAGNWRGD